MNSFSQSKEQQLALRGPIPSLYFQDTFHASKRLTIAGGVRWEPEFMPRDQFNRGSTFSFQAFMANQISSVYPTAPAGSFFYGDPGVTKSFTQNSIWQFNPNFGVTWDPSGKGNTVIRGGIQVAYDEANYYTANRNHQNPPFATNAGPNISGPICFSEPWLVGGTGPGCDQVGGTNTSPYPQPAVPLPSQADFPAQGEWIEIVSPFKVPDTLQWTLSVQREFGHGWQLQVDYIGNKTSNMPVGTALDQAIYQPGVWGPNGTGCGPVVTTGPAAKAAGTLGGGTVGSLCSSTKNQQARFLLTESNPLAGNAYAGGNTNGGGTINVNDVAWANYNGLVATVQHRLSTTFSMLTNFTWSKCLNVADASGDWSSTPFEDPYSYHMDYGRCGSDYRRIFNTSVIAKSEFNVHGIARYIINDWEFAPLIHIASGGPVNVTDSTDLSFTAEGNDRPNFVPGVKAVDFVKLHGGNAPASLATREYLNINAFCSNQTTCPNPVTLGTFGDLKRNAINGPMSFQNDAQISRIFPVKERINLAARLEAFNVLNHPSFSNPTATLTSKTFGQISSTTINARVFQGSFKVIF
jgi:hypothetical protein